MTSTSLSRIDSRVDELAPELGTLARRIHAHPELRFQEEQASRWISELVEQHGFQVERGIGKLPTAFRAVSGDRGPKMAILAEYDALPEVGHACGHNLIATAATGAFLAIAPLAAELGGRVELIGTPAEEGGGGKIDLLEAGVFEGVDAAMMVHPWDRNVLMHPTLANVWIDFVFHGRPSHAAMAPWEGKDALAACLQTFSLIDAQRVRFRDGVRVHGWIKEGGQAVNIIASRAESEFSVRATSFDELERVIGIVTRCARGAALAVDVEVEVRVRRGYREMKNNEQLARVYGSQLERLGVVARERDPSVGCGSTDMGDVSQRVPSIHPWFAICDEGVATCHQHEFATFAGSDHGVTSALRASKAMASTTLEFWTNPALRGQVRAAFEAP